MPLARIRSFDPEAIAFLAAQLAESGYTLQFVRPDESGLEEADLELTVVRRDLEEALLTAQAEAERLGVAVTVMPGVIPLKAPEPVVASEPVEVSEPVSETPELVLEAAEISGPIPMPVEVEIPESRIPVMAAREIRDDTSREKRDWVRLMQDLSEKTAHLMGVGFRKAVDGLEVIRDSARRGIESGKQGLAEMEDSTARRFSEWKMRRQRARTLRREVPRQELFDSFTAHPRNLRRPKPLWLRERIFRGAAIAAVMVLAGIIGWTLAGHAGPANPVGKGTGLSTVQEQAPFGAASASAPAVVVPARLSQKATPEPATTRSAKPARAARANDDFQEVIVRHFDQKPAAVQAKSKNHDTVIRGGVKIISEE
jgi:hypothetical protein